MNKYLSLKGCFLLSLIGVLMLFSCCQNSEVQQPQLSTFPISDITGNSAKGGGVITSDGGAAISACGVCWGLNPDPSIQRSNRPDSLHNKTFTSNLNNLIPDTVYYVRAYAVNSAGLVYGNQVKFRTFKRTLPEVTTKAPVDITSGAFRVEGEITNDGYGAILASGFCWDVKENPTVAGNKSNEIPVRNAFAAVIDGLNPETMYYVRAYATNESGTGYGNQFVVPMKAVADLSTIILIATGSTSLNATVSITFDYGTEITERGFCWGITDNPTIVTGFASVGKGLGVYTYEIGQLSPSKVYYVRAFVRNKYGIKYGITNQSKTLDPPTGINPPETVTDASGNVYKTITIGNQTWLANDLKTSKYRNGDNIVGFESLTSTVGTVGTCYSNPNYGQFYNWYAVNDPRNIAPAGWHVATDADWTLLETFLGGSDVAGGKLKENQSYWFQPNAATDDYGFKALPTGYRFGDGSFSTSGYSMGYWWTSTGSTETTAINRALYYRTTKSMRQTSDKRVGCAVRCVWN